MRSAKRSRGIRLRCAPGFANDAEVFRGLGIVDVVAKARKDLERVDALDVGSPMEPVDLFIESLTRDQRLVLYRRQAQTMRRDAEKADDPRAREVLLEVAACWESLANLEQSVVTAPPSDDRATG